MTDGIHAWGDAEWWLFFTILGLFVVYLAAGVFQALPAWARRLQRLERGRQRQRLEYERAQGAVQ